MLFTKAARNRSFLEGRKMKKEGQILRIGTVLFLVLGFSFLASCGGGGGSDAIPAPSVPAGITAAPENGGATIRWSPVSDATAYHLYIASQAGVTPENYRSLPGGRKESGVASPFTKTGLVNGSTYYIVVTSENTAGESGGSDEIRITPAAPAPVEAVAAGGTHTVALKSNGMVWSWGRNEKGQLGEGTTTRRLSPVQVNGLTGISAVAAGLNHTLALHGDGTVRSWGENRFAQLGDGTTANGLYPVQVAGLTGVNAIAGGRIHSIALKEDGTVWGWGGNSSGQLGATATDICVSTLPDCSKAPLPVAGLSGVTAIAAGAFHSVALKSDGTVWFWGDNHHAQFDGSGLDHPAPVQVLQCSTVNGITTCPPLTGVTAIAAGAFHTVALKSNGTVFTWGSNGGGQLGSGTSDDQSNPAVVAGLTGVTAVAAGDLSTLAINQDKTVTAWGDALFGRNIDGTTVKHLVPVPVPADRLSGITQVAGGGFHAVALKEDGSVWSWGDNFTGQLGNGTASDLFTPVRVIAPVP
jgi:alpha-tubulin suppressor-like RCC1 family protein